MWVYINGVYIIQSRYRSLTYFPKEPVMNPDAYAKLKSALSWGEGGGGASPSSDPLARIISLTSCNLLPKPKKGKKRQQ